jgi:hypothetical protein
MLICVALALAVVALVAVPARRDGRDLLTPKGEDVVSALKDRQQSARQRFERGEVEGGDEGAERDDERKDALPVVTTEEASSPAAPAPAPVSAATSAPVDPARS